MLPDRYMPYRFKNGLIARNRVMVPPMASSTAASDGLATEATFSHYSRLAKSRAGLIFVEYSYVHLTGKSEVYQLAADSMRSLPGLRKIASILHASGAMAGLQIVHGGGKSTTELTGGPLMAPSSLRVPVKGWEPDLPEEMSLSQIQDWIEWFCAAASLARRAGFSFVELHAAHGYGLNQWLSPITNTRTDAFGGNLENRARLLLEIVAQIKRQNPGLLVSVRIPGQDHFPSGLTSQDMIRVVAKLEDAGVDLLNVSSGIGGWRRRDSRSDEGYLVADAHAVKRHTSLPVIGVGGIETGTYIDRALFEQKLDFTAVGRAILKNPEEWSQKNLTLEEKCNSQNLCS